MSAPRVIVIGAGMGGLAAALDLAADGLEVTLLERHERIGGKMREVDVDGQGIDSGPTVFTMRWIFEDLFAHAGTRLEAELGLRPASLLARHAWLDGGRLDLFADVEQSVAAISAFAGPRDGEAYRRFVRQAGDLFDTLDKSFMRAERPGPLRLGLAVGLHGLPALLGTSPFKSLWKALNGHFQDPRLVQLFSRYATYCGSSPMLAPATLILIAEAERRGVWLVEGGMQRLAETLARLFEARGGTLRIGAGVERIETTGGRVSGVVLEAGDYLPAEAVVFAGDTRALAEGLLGPAVRNATPPPGKPRSLSALTLSLRAQVSDFPLAYHTVFFGDDYPGEFDHIFNQASVHPRPTVYVCAQDRGNEHAPTAAGAERLFCLMNAPARRLDAAELPRLEAVCREHLAAHGLQLEGESTATVRTTPNEFDAMFPATDGALYGRPTHGWAGSFTRPGSRSRIRGLYLAGASVHPGAGIPMATQSGRLAAASLRQDFQLR